MYQIHKAKAARLHSTTITLDPDRRRAVEWNLKRAGFKVNESHINPAMTVIRW